MIRTATFDTNVLPAAHLSERARAKGISVQVTSVTTRELEGTSFAEEASALPAISEITVLSESRLGQSKPAKNEDDVLDRALRIVSNGSFPRAGERDSLTGRQRAQLRDAMILAAHVREQHDVFVTADERAFIRGGRREAIEREFRTRVMLPAEFSTLLDAACERDAV